MKLRLRNIASLLISLLILPPLMPGSSVKKKEEAVASIEKHRTEIINLSDQIWGFAETALLETRFSQLLADYAEKQGFEVKRGVAGMPTAFVASYGQGRPIIGILGEYDALPGLSQKAQPVKEALNAGAAGHGCGHNLFGAASSKGRFGSTARPLKKPSAARFIWPGRGCSRTSTSVWPGTPTKRLGFLWMARKRLSSSKAKPRMRLAIPGTGAARLRGWSSSLQA